MCSQSTPSPIPKGPTLENTFKKTETLKRKANGNPFSHPRTTEERKVTSKNWKKTNTELG